MSKHVSKFRHIYGDPAKTPQQFLEIKNPLTSGEGPYVAANAKFFAVARTGGGGPVYLGCHDKPGRFPTKCPMISVHKGKCWDMDFNPFMDNMIATASEDCRAKVTVFPIEGLSETIDKHTGELAGHQKKVTHVQFNPSASSILGTASFDRSIKVWNIESSSCVSTFKQFGDSIYSFKWNANGSMIAASSKDKQLRLFDPRAPEEVGATECMDSTKSSKVFWIPRHNWVGATGFDRTAKRILRFWDPRSLDKPVYSDKLDQASSVLMPTFDDDTGVLYLVGKGQGSVSFGEIVNDARKWYSLGLYRTPEPQKGGAWVPKKGLDVWKCETMRFMKLTKKAVIPVSFIIPRKAGADVFQEDIYPDCVSGKPGLGADEWISGENKDPPRMSLDPAKRTDDDGGAVVFKKKKTYAELEADNENLKKKIAVLEAQVKELGGGVGGGGGDGYAEEAPAAEEEKDDGGDGYAEAEAEAEAEAPADEE